MKNFWRVSTVKLRVFVRRHWSVVAVVGGVLLVVFLIQFSYPRDRMLPFARLGGEPLGSRSQAETVQLVIDRYTNVPLTLNVSGPIKPVSDKTTAARAGLAPDTGRIVDELKSYPWWQRLVPFSLLAKGLTKDQAVVTRVDEVRFAEYAKERVVACAVAPKNAAVTVTGGKVSLDPAKDGQQCDTESFRRSLLAIKLERNGVTVKVAAKVVPPVRSDSDVKGLLKDAQTLTERKLALNLVGTDYAVSQTTIASWLIFSEDQKDKKRLTVDVDTKPIRDYVTEMQKMIYIAPGVTSIRTTDGVETGRDEGASGRGLNHSATAEALKKQLLEGDGTIQAELVTIPAKVAYQRSYSATRAGLQALLNDLVADKGDYGIAVRMLDGSVVSSKGSKRYHPASTYKMYVAYSLLKRIASGEIRWEDAATGGKNISQCFDVMIVNSDNTCAEWLGDKIGWASINNEVRAIGLSNTNTIRGTMYSTAEDETLFLVKLQSGMILGQAERDRLIDAMKRQVYRNGIPAGVGVTVANKVGFLDGKLHDAAIVYGPKTYTLAILSYGSTWTQIADAARQINAQLNRM